MEYFKRLNEAMDYIDEHIQNKIDFSIVCKIAGMSKSTLERTFLCATDMTLAEYIRKLRLRLAATQLIETDDKIIEVALTYGYESAAAFSRAFRNFCGKTPSEFRNIGTDINFSPIRFEIQVKEGEMKMNEESIVRIEEHVEEKVISFDVDCTDPENEAWNQMAAWCRQYIPDRTARRFVGYAPQGHHPNGEAHSNADEHVSHPYRAQMYLIGDECKLDTFHGKEVIPAPQGLFLVNSVALNQYDENGNLDIALSMMKASEAFVEFVKQTEGYEFDCQRGIFYEEHIFSEKWFQNGGLMDGFKMWVPVLKK